MVENSVFVKGPINLARVEGNINGVNKIFHFFMDYHENVQHQTTCTDIRSKDISQYLIQKFDEISKTNKEAHFFIESIPAYHADGPTETEGRYADRVINMLIRTFTKKIKNGEIMYSSEEFDKIKLHYVDVRSYIFKEIDDLFSELLNYRSVVWNKKNLNSEVINDMEKIVIKLKSKLTELWKRLSSDSPYTNTELVGGYNIDSIQNIEKTLKALKEEPDSDQKNALMGEIKKEYIIKKVKSSYKDPKVCKAINNYIMTDMGAIFKDLFEQSDELLENFKDIKNKIDVEEDVLVNSDEYGVSYGAPRQEIVKYVSNLEPLINDYFKKWFVKIPSKFMDLYILRKLLDRDYENVILYTGIEHSVSMIYFLVKNFGFKITNMSSVTETTVEELNSKLKSGEDYDKIRYHFFPEKLKQCISVGNFPSMVGEDISDNKKEDTQEGGVTKEKREGYLRDWLLKC